MGNAGESLQFGFEDEEGEDVGEHRSHAEIAVARTTDEEEDGGMASNGRFTTEYGSVHA